MCENFSLLTCRATSNVVFNPWAHVGPPEEPFGFSNRFISSWVSGHVAIVNVGHKFSSEALVRWYH